MAAATLKRFAAALTAALDDRVQAEVARAAGISPQLLSDWKAGRREPGVQDVFRVERELALTPGHLSKHLGYVPYDARQAVERDLAAETARQIETYLGDDLDAAVELLGNLDDFAEQFVERNLRRELLRAVLEDIEREHGPAPEAVRRQARQDYDRAFAAAAGDASQASSTADEA